MCWHNTVKKTTHINHIEPLPVMGDGPEPKKKHPPGKTFPEGHKEGEGLFFYFKTLKVALAMASSSLVGMTRMATLLPSAWTAVAAFLRPALRTGSMLMPR